MRQCLLNQWLTKLYRKLTLGSTIYSEKKQFLTTNLRLLLCNALIQPHFHYACTAWYANLCKKLKNKIQTTKNKCVRFCLNLDEMAHIS